MCHRVFCCTSNSNPPPLVPAALTFGPHDFLFLLMWHTQTKIRSLCCTCMHIVSHTNLDGNAQIWNKTLVEWPGDLLLSYNLMGVFNKYLNNVEIYSSGSYTNLVFCFACKLIYFYSLCTACFHCSGYACMCLREIEGKGEGRYHWLMQCGFG